MGGCYRDAHGGAGFSPDASSGNAAFSDADDEEGNGRASKPTTRAAFSDSEEEPANSAFIYVDKDQH